MQPARRIVIVGGGISGLAVAWALRQRGERASDLPPPEVVVVERDARPGGKILSERVGGFLCEWGPNGFLDREPATLELCSELGLGDELLPATAAFAKRYIYRAERLHVAAAHPLRFLASDLLPWRAKLRLLREPWVAARRPDDARDESVLAFAARRIGPLAARLLIDPMQSGIYAGDPARLSVASCFPRVVEIERQYGSLIRGLVALRRERRRGGAPGDPRKPSATPGAGPSGHLTSLRSGLQLLPDTLARRLGSALKCGQDIERVTRSPSGDLWRVHRRGRPPLLAEVLVLACPAHAAAALLDGVDANLAASLRGIDYAPLAVAALGYRREQVRHPLDGFGFLAPRNEGLRLLGTLWDSTIFGRRAPAGHVLLRAMVGGARDRAITTLAPEAIALAAHEALRPLLGIDGPPVLAEAVVHQRAIPQYNLGHRERVAQLTARLGTQPGLVLAGNALHGVGINDCARNARRVAAEALAQLARPSLPLAPPSETC
ncbi:MAG: protoporphyrinogen oxidase [Proteobacteria bacterium]|nr:protoporphyrinogen oxidase [Pseudomonadota bacterium]